MVLKLLAPIYNYNNITNVFLYILTNENVMLKYYFMERAIIG